MAEEPTNELMLKILRDLQDGQNSMRREMDARFDTVNQRFDSVEERLDTIETTVSGLAGMIALVYGEQMKVEERVDKLEGSVPAE